MTDMSSNIRNAKGANTLAGQPSFTLRFRLMRLLWLATWALLAAWTPRPFFGWRRNILQLFGARMQPTSRVHSSVRVWWPGNLMMGANSSIGPRANIYSMGMISIGDDVVISQDAHLCAGTHDFESAGFQLKAVPIAIGNNAWIAAEAFVAPGATVADGVVLAARCAAFGQLQPWTVYRGNPATPLRPRNRWDVDGDAPCGS